MESLFGDMPLPAKFLIAFIVVLALIGGVAYLVRRFGAGGLSSSASRGRQPRLGVIEAAAVDSRRRLVLIRRDNVEHLIMLGGPTDVVVEMNIVRGQPAAPIREAAPVREPPRATPAPETMWPLAPEPAARPRPPADRIPPLAEDLPLQPHVEPAPRTPAPDRLASLAAEFSRGAVRAEPPAPRAPAPELRRTAAPEPSADERNLTDIAHRLEAALRRPGSEPAAKPTEPPVRSPAEAMPAFGARRPASERPPASERSAYAPRASRMPEPAPAAAPAPEAAEATVEPKEAPAPEGSKETKPGAPADQTKPQAAPGEPEAKPAGKTVYESLEQEMASLLGRPTGKT